MKLDVYGIIPPVLTPFRADNEDIDVPALQAEVEYLIQSGSHGICVGGSTGEGAGLTAEEVYTICKATVDQAKGRVPVIGGIIPDTTREAILKGRAAKEAGVMSLQVTPPHYLWTPTDEDLVRHYTAIGEALRLPILIYNVVPWVNINLKSCQRIADVPWVAGIKQSGGDMHKLADLLRFMSDRYTVITAVDDLLYPSFALGSHGAISCMLAVLPQEYVRMWNLVKAGDHAGALAIQNRLLPVWRAIEGPDMVAKAKAAIDLLGRKGGVARSPIPAPDAAALNRIRTTLVEAGYAVTQ